MSERKPLDLDALEKVALAVEPTPAFDMHGGYGRCSGIGKVWVDDGEASNFYEGGHCPRCTTQKRPLTLDASIVLALINALREAGHE